MSNATYAKVKEFHETFRAKVGTEPSIDTGFEKLRVALIAEEVNETLLAIMTNDEVEFADGLGDMDYVIEGAAITFGVEIDEETLTHARGMLAKENYVELIGHLVLGVRGLNEFLMPSDTYPEDYRIRYVIACLTNLKAVVWEIAERAKLPLAEIIEVIHESNMSKLGEDGHPIFREDGKILKGPGFFTPTAKIKELLGVE
jgi:predicted HAD superfamily Cof-like phosphohydrolase